MTTKLNDLFFPVQKSLLIVNNRDVYKYYAITSEQSGSFLGIKRSKHSYITNEAAYDKLLRIYKKLTHHFPDPFNWWMNEDRNQCAVIASEQSMDQFVINFWPDILTSLNREFPKMNRLFFLNDNIDSISTQSETTENQFNSFVKNRLVYLDLAIGFVNGYDIDQNCNYYLMVRWIDNDKRVKYLSISRKKENFDIEQMANDFRNDLIKFIITSFKRYITPIEIRFIRPILFNIYNKNIELNTIQNDDAYREALFTFNQSTHDFVNKLQEFNYYAFTEFIIRNCYLYEWDELNLKIRNRESIITVNEVYQSSVSRLKNLYDNEKNRKAFELGNFERLEAVEKLFLG